jgi:hypothetical protein
MQIVPFTSDPRQKFSCNLNGVEYGFAANYNERSGVWAFDLSRAATEEVLLTGVPILLGCDMLAPFGLNIGSLITVDASASPAWALAGDGETLIPVAQTTDADPFGAFNDDLGTRVLVVYLKPGEVPA